MSIGTVVFESNFRVALDFCSFRSLHPQNSKWASRQSGQRPKPGDASATSTKSSRICCLPGICSCSKRPRLLKICLDWGGITAWSVQNGSTRKQASPHTPRASLTREDSRISRTLTPIKRPWLLGV